MTVYANKGMIRLCEWVRAHAGRIFVCLGVAVLLFNASCERRPLYDPDNFVHIKVTVNTDSISNVTCHQYNPDITAPSIDPKMMRVLFYNTSGSSIAADTYISSVSEDAYGRPVIEGDVSVLPGDYKLLIYNFDTESTLIRDDSEYNTIEAYTNVVNSAITKRFATKVDDAISNSIYYEPDHLMVARDETTSIPYHEGIYTLSETAFTVVQTYYLQIKVKNAQYVSSAQAILSGLSSGNLIGSDAPVVDPQAIVYFTLQKSTDDGDDVIACIFNTFGKIENVENELAVTFNVYTTYGNTVQITKPITDVFETEDAIKRHWLLIEDEIVIPEPEKNTNSNSGGWSPGVNEWETENHEISI